MKGMPGQNSQPPPRQPQSGPGIDWGRVFGPLLTPQRGPMIYPGEPTPEPPETIDLLWPTDSKPGLQMPPEIPRVPEQQEPTPSTKPSTTNILDSAGGTPSQTLTGPPKENTPATGQTPADLLDSSQGNTKIPPTESAKEGSGNITQDDRGNVYIDGVWVAGPDNPANPKPKPSPPPMLGMTPQVLGAPVPPQFPETKSEQSPQDLLNNSPGNTQMPPGNQFAGPPEWNTPSGPGVKFLPPHGPADQDTIDSGKELRAKEQKDKDKELGKALENAENEIVNQAEKDEAARQAAKELINKAGELPKKAQEAVTELQKQAEDLQKKAQEAIDQMKKDAATDVGINEIDKIAKEADKANQAQQAKADAEQKAKAQAEHQRKEAEANAKEWQKHQAKVQKEEQAKQAQAQEQQRQQAQQAQQAQQQQQQNEALKKQEQKELEDIGGAGKKYIK